MTDFDALARQVGQVPIPVLLLVHGCRDDDHVVRADPAPGSGRSSLLGHEEERDNLAPAQRSWSSIRRKNSQVL